jgi:hypothetical protein
MASTVLRRVRVVALLLILATVAQTAWMARSRATDWRSSLLVTIYPIHGEASAPVADYVARLDRDEFEPIEQFVQREAQRYGIETLQPVAVSVAPPVRAQPPAPPATGNPLAAIVWSLRLRYWAWRHDDYTGPKPQIRLYVIYHDANRTDRVPHSLGLEKGMIGVIHAFGARRMTPQNNVVIAHELLHTLGARDKYDPASNLPRFPEGYAAPGQNPLHPQHQAEIMGGRTPVSASQADIPAGLDDVVVGPATAQEIGWVKD